MKHKGTKKFLTILLTPLLLFLGGLFSNYFFVAVIDQLKDVQVVSTELFDFSPTLVFASAIGILPILMYVSDLGVIYEKSWNFLSTLAFTLSMGWLFVFLRITYLNGQLESIPKLPGIQESMPFSSIHAEYYLGFGFMFGMLVATLFFMFFGKTKAA